jgi:hypothetical protein
MKQFHKKLLLGVRTAISLMAVAFFFLLYKPRSARAADPDSRDWMASIQVSPTRERKEPTLEEVFKGEAVRKMNRENRLQRREAAEAERMQRALIKSTHRLDRRNQMSVSERWLGRSYPASIQRSLAEAKKMLAPYCDVEPSDLSWNFKYDQLSPQGRYDTAFTVAGSRMQGQNWKMPDGRPLPENVVNSIIEDLDSRREMILSLKAVQHIMDEGADDETDLVEVAVKRFDQACVWRNSVCSLRSTRENLCLAMVDETEINTVTAEAEQSATEAKTKYRDLRDKAQAAAVDADLSEIRGWIYW